MRLCTRQGLVALKRARAAMHEATHPLGRDLDHFENVAASFEWEAVMANASLVAPPCLHCLGQIEADSRETTTPFCWGCWKQTQTPIETGGHPVSPKPTYRGRTLTLAMIIAMMLCTLTCTVTMLWGVLEGTMRSGTATAFTLSGLASGALAIALACHDSQAMRRARARP